MGETEGIGGGEAGREVTSENALNVLRQKLAQLVEDEETVALAYGKHIPSAAYVFTGINKDWDPQDHPRDPNTGEFVKGPTGFIFGKTKSATFAVQGKAQKVDLKPGDVAFKTPAGNVVVSHADGSYTLHHGTHVSEIPAGNKSTIAQKVMEGEYQKVGENPGVVVEADDEEQAADKLAHPDQYGKSATAAIATSYDAAAAKKNLADKYKVSGAKNKDGSGHVRAHDDNGDLVGELTYNKNGQISWVASYVKGEGIATGLLEFAKEDRPDIHHSLDLSGSAEGWAAKTPLPPNPLIQQHGVFSYDEAGGWKDEEPKDIKAQDGDILEVQKDEKVYRGIVTTEHGQQVLDAKGVKVALNKPLPWRKIGEAKKPVQQPATKAPVTEPTVTPLHSKVGKLGGGVWSVVIGDTEHHVAGNAKGGFYISSGPKGSKNLALDHTVKYATKDEAIEAAKQKGDSEASKGPGKPVTEPQTKAPVTEPTTPLEAAQAGQQSAWDVPKPTLKGNKTKFTAKQYAEYQKATLGKPMGPDANSKPIKSGDWVEYEGKPYRIFASPHGTQSGSKSDFNITAYRWVSTKQQASNLEKEDLFTLADFGQMTVIEDPTGKPYGGATASTEGEVAPKHGSLMSQATAGAIPNTATAHKKHVAEQAGKPLTTIGTITGQPSPLSDINSQPLKSGDWVEIDGKPVQVHSSPNKGNVAIAKWVSTKQQASNNTYDFSASVLGNAIKIEDPTGKPYKPLSKQEQAEKPAAEPEPSGAPSGSTVTKGSVTYTKQPDGKWTLANGITINSPDFIDMLESEATAQPEEPPAPVTGPSEVEIAESKKTLHEALTQGEIAPEDLEPIAAHGNPSAQAAAKQILDALDQNQILDSPPSEDQQAAAALNSPYPLHPQNLTEETFNDLPLGTIVQQDPEQADEKPLYLLKTADNEWSVLKSGQKDKWATVPDSSVAGILALNPQQALTVLPVGSEDNGAVVDDPTLYPIEKSVYFNFTTWNYQQGAWHDAATGSTAGEEDWDIEDAWEVKSALAQQILDMEPGDELHVTKNDQTTVYKVQADGMVVNTGVPHNLTKPKSFYADFLDKPVASKFKFEVLAAGESSEDATSKQQQFVHPVSGVVFPLEPGDTVHKHKTTPHGYIVVKGSGDNPINFFTQNGKQQKPKANQKNLATSYEVVDTWPGKVDEADGEVVQPDITPGQGTSPHLIENAASGDKIYVYDKHDQTLYQTLTKNGTTGDWDATDAAGAPEGQVAATDAASVYGTSTATWDFQFWPNGTKPSIAQPVAPGTLTDDKVLATAKTGDQIYVFDDEGSQLNLYVKQGNGQWQAPNGYEESEINLSLGDAGAGIVYKFYPSGTQPGDEGQASPWGSKDASGTPQTDPEPISTKSTPKPKGKKATKPELPKSFTKPDGGVIDLKPGEAYAKVKDEYGSSEYYVHVTQGPKSGWQNTNHIYNLDGSATYWDKAKKWTPASMKSWIKKNGGELLAENVAVTEKFDYAAYGAEDAGDYYNSVYTYITDKRASFPIGTSYYGSIYGYNTYSQFDDKTWQELDTQQKLSLVASYEELAGKAVATLEPLAKVDWLDKSEKQEFGKARTGFALIHRIAVLAREIDNPDTDWDDERFESEIAFVATKVAKPGVSLGGLLKGKYALGDVHTLLLSANNQRQFKNSLTNLDFDAYNGTTEEYDTYAKSKGFQHLAALTEDQQKTWVLSDLGDPTISQAQKNAIAQAAEKAKTKVAIADLAATLKKKQALSGKPLAKTKAKGIHNKAALKDSYTWTSEGVQYEIKNIGHDEWLFTNDTDPSDGLEVTDAVVFQLVNAALEDGHDVTASEEDAYGTDNPHTTLQKLAEKHGVPDGDFTDISTDQLAAIVGSLGGGPATTGDDHTMMRHWLWAYARGDEIAKYNIEKQAQGGFHPNVSTHPGSSASPAGKAAHKALAELLSTTPEGQAFLEGDYLPLTQKKALAASLGTTEQHIPALGLSDGYAPWFTFHDQADLQANAPGTLGSAAASVASKPVNVPNESWVLVNTVEGTTDLSTLFPEDTGLGAMTDEELTSLLSNSNTAANAGLIAPLVAAVPTHLKRLALWGATDDTDDEYRTGILLAVAAKAKAGEYMAEDTPAWVAPSGAKYPISPGSTVYNASDLYEAGTYVVTGPPKADGSPSDVGWKFVPGKTPIKFSGYHLDYFQTGQYGTVVFTMPGAVHFDQAQKDIPDLSKAYWDESVLIEEGQSTTYTHHESGAILTASLKKNTDLQENYPHLYAQYKTLPENVRQAVLAALTSTSYASPKMLEVMEYKASKGHYATMGTKGLFDSAQPWLPFLSKGQVTADDVANNWSPEAKNAYTGFFSLGSENDIADHIDSLLNPEIGTVTTRLPDFKDLKLTKTGKTLGGMHTKHVWVDQDGNEWMSKAFNSDPNAKARVDSETGAVRIGRLFGFRTPAANTQPVPGYEYAYLQHLAPAKGDLASKGPGDLTTKQLQQAMEEHLLDWITANHDTHPSNLMLAPNGDVFGIDKGQAFKHFPKDKLAVGYLPPENGAAVWYDQFYRALQKGQISKETADEVTKHVLRRAQQISKDKDEEYRAELNTALQNRTFWPDQYPSRDEFIDGLVERKHDLFSDFVDFYKSLYADSPYEFDIDTENLVPPKLGDHTHIAVSTEYATDVFRAGIHGKAIFFETTDLEDSHIMFSKVLATDKEPMLTGSARVRENAEASLMDWLKKQTIENNVGHMSNSYNDYDSTAVDVIDPAHLPGNTDWFSALVAGSKTVSSHNASGDKQYNQTTLDKMDSVHEQIKAARTVLDEWKQDNPDTPFKGTLPSSGSMNTQATELVVELHTIEQQNAWENMLETYTEYAEKVNDHKGTDQKISPHFTQYAYTPSETALALVKAKQAAGKDMKPFLPPKIEDILKNAKNGDVITVTAPGGGTTFTKKHGGWANSTSGGTASSEDLAKKIKDLDKLGTPFTLAYSGIVPGVPETSGFNTWATKQDPGAQVTFETDEGSNQTYTLTEDGLWGIDGDTESAQGLQKYVTDQGWKIADVKTAEEVEEISATVKVGSKVLKVVYRKAASKSGKLNDEGELEMTNSEIDNFDWGHMYEIDFGNTVIEYRPWDESAGVAKAHRGSLRFRKANWKEGDADSIDDVLDVLRHIGLRLDNADEDSMELFYWRHMTGTIRDRKDGKATGRYGKIVKAVDDARAAKPDMTKTEELEVHKAAWADVIGQEKVDRAQWMPQFSRNRMQALADSDDIFTAGRPYWLRPDVTASELKSITGNSYVASSLKSGYHALTMVKSGAALSSDERYRVLSEGFVTGWSSGTDAVSYGSSNVVYTRQNRGLNWNSGYDSHVYYHPKVLLRSHNYAFGSDTYGDIEAKKNSTYDPQDWKGYTGGSNELLLRYGVSVMDDIAFIQFPTASARNEAIKYYKDRGITIIHGLPIEQIFVTDRSEGKKILDKLWADMIAEETANA